MLKVDILNELKLIHRMPGPIVDQNQHSKLTKTYSSHARTISDEQNKCHLCSCKFSQTNHIWCKSNERIIVTEMMFLSFYLGFKASGEAQSSWVVITPFHKHYVVGVRE